MKYSTLFFIAFLILCGVSVLYAQPNPQPPGGPPTPIDGGLTLLLAAGGAYGVKKYREFKNEA
ncbi:MAG: hypothetical protein JJU02_09100 [Cryomorphaceae bacterium]|nr:hypothetical protein [Cryomorphaceae bacterium]